MFKTLFFKPKQIGRAFSCLMVCRLSGISMRMQLLFFTAGATGAGKLIGTKANGNC